MIRSNPSRYNEIARLHAGGVREQFTREMYKSVSIKHFHFGTMWGNPDYQRHSGGALRIRIEINYGQTSVPPLIFKNIRARDQLISTMLLSLPNRSIVQLQTRIKASG
jgi:hypothetical protein